MSLSFDQIVSDAKKLVNRLRQRENDADELLKETQTVKWKIDDFNQYREEVETLNKTFNENGRSLNYLATLKDDNSYLANLQKENQQLQALIEDYQNVMEHIMLKYRKHVSRNIFESHLDLKTIVDQYQSETIMKQAEKINEMISVMSYAASIDDDTSTKVREIIAQLYKENQVLRELLKISKDYGESAIGLPTVSSSLYQNY